MLDLLDKIINLLQIRDFIKNITSIKITPENIILAIIFLVFILIGVLLAIPFAL